MKPNKLSSRAKLAPVLYGVPACGFCRFRKRRHSRGRSHAYTRLRLASGSVARTRALNAPQRRTLSLVFSYAAHPVGEPPMAAYEKRHPKVSFAVVVGLNRLELSTSRLSGVCSNQLSYNPLVPLSGACGGDARIRTEDLLNANQALYQLSYTPAVNA